MAAVARARSILHARLVDELEARGRRRGAELSDEGGRREAQRDERHEGDEDQELEGPHIVGRRCVCDSFEPCRG